MEKTKRKKKKNTVKNWACLSKEGTGKRKRQKMKETKIKKKKKR